MQFINPITDRTPTYSKTNLRLNTSSKNLLLDSNGTEMLIFSITSKPCLNYSDLNRIELNCEYLEYYLSMYGFPVDIIVKTNWTMADYPTRVEIDRIRNNINALLTAYYTVTGSPIIVYRNTLDFNDVNTLEINIKNINDLLEDMISSFKYCGTFNCGQEVIL